MSRKIIYACDNFKCRKEADENDYNKFIKISTESPNYGKQQGELCSWECAQRYIIASAEGKLDLFYYGENEDGSTDDDSTTSTNHHYVRGRGRGRAGHGNAPIGPHRSK
jgi:hypothetical protein